jgi:FkbM family methyltransferase
MQYFFKKIKKLIRLLCVKSYRKALYHNVAATTEHEKLLQSLDCSTLIDIGANRGQFSLVARYSFPNAKIFSFEPLPKPAKVFQELFLKDNNVKFYGSAIGPEPGRSEMHVSCRDDSSSLLPISDLQNEVFPGTGEAEVIDVLVSPLSAFIDENDIASPAVLKLDVQGFELDALRGCESLLSKFEFIYCECSFMELYSGQKMATDVIAWLYDRNFTLQGIYNTSYDKVGISVQSDFMFIQADSEKYN